MSSAERAGRGAGRVGSPTEGLLDAARDLDKLSVERVLEVIHEQDAVAHHAVGRVRAQMVEAVDVLVCALAGGGRWFNVGAGTSGRLGVLDASEIPPTFGMPAQIVQGVIAGGDRALRHPVEGAEDDAEAAKWELRERGLTMGDAVVAISASGNTPYAQGALEIAHEVGARRIAITSNPDSPLAHGAEVTIAPDTGAEVIAGSTRMKAGIAQKMVLHALSTAVMVQLGRVEGNLMTHLTPVSQKLQGRALRILMTLGGVDEERALALLDTHEGRVEEALRDLRSSA
ncbi:MAG: N-acetylmuramic acid 6-phosphate etherase [Myxococcota bacterium]